MLTFHTENSFIWINPVFLFEGHKYKNKYFLNIMCFPLQSKKQNLLQRINAVGFLECFIKKGLKFYFLFSELSSDQELDSI
jgi:hypothetical protein